ncbi:MAG: hypothetical protein H0V13_11885 [Nocardioidaceae bacterium]|nr:hypothetical protein [Nocardioidaceae bacterium]
MRPATPASLFSGHPWTYPGEPLAQPARLEPWEHAGRRPVVAFGSNTDPAVVRDKLSRGGIHSEIPMTPAVLPDVALAASAHVSVGGYIPAAVQHRAGSRLRVVVSWPDPEQLACLDASEPNYRPVVVRDLELLDGRRVGAALLYATRRGVVELPGPLSQTGVWRHVLAVVPGLVQICGVQADAGEPALRELMLLAACTSRLRERITGRLQAVAVPAGLAQR